MAVEYNVGGLAIDLKLNGYDTAMSQINELKKSLKSGGGSSGGKGSSGISKSITQMFNIGKFHYFVNMSKQYTRILANMFQSAVDYNETLNLWQVAMRGNITLAEEFISKMSRSYGLAEETLMRYQATFKNMLASLGDLEDGISTKLSEVILARAIDFASLYNITNERAMTMFQAVLSGQVRPIRSVSGYDITENTIFDMYRKAGGDKTVRQLSQIEKRLLRIYAIFNQMDTSGATGDWAKQIEEPANQLRILGEQFKELGQWIGQLFLNVFAPILPKLNAFVMTVKEITKALAHMAGYVKPDHLEDFESVITDTDEAVESLTGKLFSFDKFDVAGGGSTSNIFGIDPTVQGLLDSMNTSIKDITMEATKLSEQWLSSIGFIKKMKTETNELGEEVQVWTGEWEMSESLIKNLKPIISVFNAISTGFKFLQKAIGWLDNELQFMGGLLNTLWISAQIGLHLITGGLSTLILYWDEIVYGLNIAINWIKTTFWNVVNWINNSVIIPIGNFFSNLWKGIANGFASMINWISNGFVALVNLAIDVINAILKPVDMIAGLFGGKVQIGHWNAQVNWQPYPTYADGGFPKQGQMFIAREAGPEMVGNIGGKTAVANNDQIVAGVAGGVREAVQPLVTIGQAIYRTMQSGGSMQINIDGQKLANSLTPRIKGNLVREGVVL